MERSKTQSIVDVTMAFGLNSTAMEHTRKSQILLQGDSFSRKNKVEQVEVSILEIIEESKTNKKIVEHQVEKQKQISVMKSTIDGGKIPTKRTKNEVQMEKIETEEKERDWNKFELSVFSAVFSVSSSVGSVLNGYQSLEEHDAFKDDLELR